MDNHNRTRDSRKSSMPSSATANAFPRRRHPTISLRGSPQEGQGHVEVVKAKRERDSSSKRRRGCNSLSTEEDSVGNEQHYDVQDVRVLSPNTASSASDHNHRRISASTPLRPRNITDEMIGATVPRKARSASVKRAHDNLVDEAASPSSSNVSIRKKIKSNEPKTRLSKTASSSTQEDIEIEIAELLYGLRSSKSLDASSLKREASDLNPPRSTSPSMEAEKKKLEDFSSITMALNNSTAESVRIESEQPAKLQKPSPEPARISGGHEIGSSEGRKEEEENLDSGNGKSGTVAAESPSSSKSKLGVDKQDSSSNRAMSTDVEANGKRVDKFEIDLMAPPPSVTLSPERDNLSLSKSEDCIRVERPVKKEKAQGEVEGVTINFDLEKSNKHNAVVKNHELEMQERKKEQFDTLTNPNVEKTVRSSSVPLSTAASERPSILSTSGSMPPLEAAVKTGKTEGSLTAPQHVNFVLSQPRPKRCASHHYIARNIFMHQQCTKMNPFLPPAIGYGSLCDTKHNVNRVQSAESLVGGKQSQKHSPIMSQNAVQEKIWAAASDFSLAAIKSSGSANPIDSSQMKQIVLQQGSHPGSSGNPVHGPAFLYPLGLHQASVTAPTSQVGSASSNSSAASSHKSHCSSAGSLSTSTLPPVATAMSFSYPNLAACDAPYMTIVQNSGYPFPFSTPLGAPAAIRGANPTQATPMLNGHLYSSQIFHPLQYPQQIPHSQALVQPSYLNASTSSVSSSSHKQSQGTQANSKSILTSSTIQLQQSQKQSTSLSHTRNKETGISGENAPSVVSGTTFSQKNLLGQNFTFPVQPLNLSFRPSATSDNVGGNSGNFGDKQQQQQQSLKVGVEQMSSQPFAISFATYNGTSVPSNLNFSTMAPNPVIFQSLPDITWPGYQTSTTSHTSQQKAYSITEGKNGANSSHQDDEKKAISGKPSSNGPTTLVFDNSSKNLNFVPSIMNGNWPGRSIPSTATVATLPLSSNTSNSQQPPQLLHLQQQQVMLQQQPAMATRLKTSTTATKFLTSPPVFSQTQTQCKSSNQGSQSKNLGRTSDSQVHSTSIITSTTPTLKSFSQEQGIVLPGHAQISFGGNYISPLPPQGQLLLSNNQSFGTTVSGTASNGGNMKTNSQGSKVSSSVNSSQMQQTENSSSGTGQKSSPVCGRNVQSILSSCPSHLSELKY